MLRCLSARELHEGGMSKVAAEAPETKADYESFAASVGLTDPSNIATETWNGPT